MAYIAKVRCVVYKSVYCENCTEDDVWFDPWAHAIDEQEIDQHDWEVVDVKASA